MRHYKIELYTEMKNYCDLFHERLLNPVSRKSWWKENPDNKQFWKVVRPLFSDKSISGDKINLTENG